MTTLTDAFLINNNHTLYGPDLFLFLIVIFVAEKFQCINRNIKNSFSIFH